MITSYKFHRNPFSILAKWKKLDGMRQTLGQGNRCRDNGARWKHNASTRQWLPKHNNGDCIELSTGDTRVYQPIVCHALFHAGRPWWQNRQNSATNTESNETNISTSHKQTDKQTLVNIHLILNLSSLFFFNYNFLHALLLLVCVSFTIIGQPQNSVFIRRV